MDRIDWSKYTTEYQRYLIEHYGDGIPYSYDEEDGYARINEFEFMLGAPEQYENEDEMLDYAKAHPDATMRELVEYFDEITPDGLPPCASEWDDDDDDE